MSVLSSVWMYVCLYVVCVCCMYECMSACIMYVCLLSVCLFCMYVCMLCGVGCVCVVGVCGVCGWWVCVGVGWCVWVCVFALTIMARVWGLLQISDPRPGHTKSLSVIPTLPFTLSILPPSLQDLGLFRTVLYLRSEMFCLHSVASLKPVLFIKH